MAAGTIVLVTGATGKQGGATLRHLAKRGAFKLRAATRKPERVRVLRLRFGSMGFLCTEN